MEGLGTAASVIAVIELSAKVSSLCYQYYASVNNAKNDIDLLCEELSQLKSTLEGARRLLEGPHAARLKTSQPLHDGVSSCSSRLTKLQIKLENKLQPGIRQKIKSRLSKNALKWPFESKDVNKILEGLRRYRDTLNVALTVDQTSEILKISQEQVLSKLPIAKHAAFDSYADEHDARCHPETRVELRKEIIRWADDPQGECIFWLNGVAGTGKSTISRTLAQSFANQACLGGSFFFKRGERDRGNAALLFTTISVQLVTLVPALAPHVRAAIEADPTFPNKALKEQFEKLILEPLGKLEGHLVKRVILVIDALDECEREDDVKVIIYLLSRVKTLGSVWVRVFVTSRPELPIRLGFSDIRDKYQDLLLHEIPTPIIEHDITAYLRDELDTVRDQYNKSVAARRQLVQDWPGRAAVQILVEMAIPLFIFAATTIRFLKDRRGGGPDEQLAKILKYRTRSQVSKLHATYLPVLNQLTVDLPDSEKEDLISDFRRIVGSIVILTEPLSITSLSALIGVPETKVDNTLDFLHSVLSVPSDPTLPIRLIHLSFRDFLVDPKNNDNNPFWVDERATHEQIASRCLQLLSTSGHLKKDICDVKQLGAARADVKPLVIESSLPAHVRYACLYWVHHLEQSKTTITDDHTAYKFLQRHFLHWLEALSLLGRISDCVAMISSLRALLSPSMSPGVAAFFHDANRFLLNYRSIIDLCPLQLYASAIVFTPQESIVRDLFKTHVPEWISLLPKVDYTPYYFIFYWRWSIAQNRSRSTQSRDNDRHLIL